MGGDQVERRDVGGAERAESVWARPRREPRAGKHGPFTSRAFCPLLVERGGSAVTPIADQRPSNPRTKVHWFDSGPWVGVAAGLVLVMLIAVLIVPAILRNGEFTYPVDDSYIHLAISQNLAEHGVLGINPDEFSSASSSPIWPLLIASGILVAGPRVGVPLALAIISALALLIGLDRWAQNRGFGFGERTLFIGSLLIVVPLPVLALTGMEHVLQAAVSFLLLWLGVVAATRADRNRSTVLILSLASFFCVATRFEGVFVVAATMAVLAWARRWKEVVAVAVAGAVPLLIVGLVNSGQGWPVLPASVVAKTTAATSGLARYLPTPDVYQWLRTPRLVSVVALTLLVALFGRRAMGSDWPVRNTLFSVGALIVSGLHLLYAHTGFFYRYEAYLMVLCLAAVALGLHTLLAAGRLGSMNLAFRIGVVALLVVAGVDGVRIYGKAAAGMNEIHQQQIQMARFAASACPGCRVAVNDIGAVAFYGDGTVMDVFGIANNSVLQRRLDGDYDGEAVGDIAREEGVSLAMVYPPKEFSMIPSIPDGWDRLGSWRIESNQVVGEPVVDFYSVDPSRTAQLQRAWNSFDPAGAKKGA